MKYQKYIGTKIIEAMACDAGHAASILNRPVEADVNEPGFLVVYPDGYKSWSPLKAFEEAYRLSDNMPFGLAIEALKKGQKVARSGWNGKDMFLFLLPAGTIPKSAIHDGALATVVDKVPGDTFEALATIRMWTVNSEGRRAVLTGWLASQTDMLSDDWFIVE